jgi:hypothetical protein
MREWKMWILISFTLFFGPQHYRECQRVCRISPDPLSVSRMGRLHSLVMQVLLDDEAFQDSLVGSEFLELHSGNLHNFGKSAQEILGSTFWDREIEFLLVFKNGNDIGITCTTIKEMAVLMPDSSFFRLPRTN